MSYAQRLSCLAILAASYVVAGDSAAQDAKNLRGDLLASQVADSFLKLRSVGVRMWGWHEETPATLVFSVIAAKGEARYEELWHGETELQRHRDPDSMIRFYNGTSYNVYYPFWRRYEVTQKFAVQPYLSKIHGHFFYECFGWWPPGDANSPPVRDGNPQIVLDILRDDRLVHRSSTEVVAGAECHIMEIPRFVKLWVDPEIRVIRRRQELSQDKYSDTTRTIATYEFSDFSEVSVGVWLPQTIERRFTNGNQKTIHKLQYFDVNRIEDELFSVGPLPGTLVWDRDTDAVRQIPGGLDCLEGIATMIEEEYSYPAPAITPTSILFPVVAFCCGLFVIPAFSCVVRRRRAAKG